MKSLKKRHLVAKILDWQTEGHLVSEIRTTIMNDYHWDANPLTQGLISPVVHEATM